MEKREGYCSEEKRLVRAERETAGWGKQLAVALVAVFTCGIGGLLMLGSLKPGAWTCPKCGGRARVFEKEER